MYTSVSDKVVVLKCAAYTAPQVDESLRRMLELAGMVICRPGQRVLIKPNMLAPDPADSACNTHPAVVEGVIKLVKSAGGKPFLGDKPVLWSARRVAEVAGILEVCRRHGVPVIEFGRNRQVHSKDGAHPPLHIAEQVYEYDTIINLAKWKAHVQLGLSLGVKNMFGCVSLPRRVWRHFSADSDCLEFAKMLLRVYLALKPHFTIVDGITAMEERGPRGGRPRNLGLLVGSANAVAGDRVIMELLGLPYHTLPTLAAAQTMGIPGWNMERIQVLGEEIRQARIEDFKMPPLQDISFELKRSLKILLRRMWGDVRH